MEYINVKMNNKYIARKMKQYFEGTKDCFFFTSNCWWNTVKEFKYLFPNPVEISLGRVVDKNTGETLVDETI